MAGRGPRRHPIRLIALAAALGAASFGFSVASATAAPVVTAECPGPNNGATGLGADWRMAQTFTAQVTGTLVQGEIEVTKPTSTSGNWTMEIYATDGAGNPTNTVLAATTIADAGVPTGAVRLVGSFSTPLVIEAGQRYALSLRRSASWTVRDRTTNPCEGSEFFSISPSGDWNSIPAFDMVFAVRVEPLPELAPGPEPGPKADGTLTIDANKGKVEKGRKVTLSGQYDVASNESCEPGRSVEIQRRLKSEDDSKFATFATVQTDASGNYSLKVKVKKTYFYRAVVSETEACDDETSNSQKVRVQKKKPAQEA